MLADTLQARETASIGKANIFPTGHADRFEAFVYALARHDEAILQPDISA